MGRIFIVVIFFWTAVAGTLFAQGILYYDNSIKVYQGENLLKDPWAGGLNAAQFGMIDFDGDGINDLVVYDRSSDMVNTFRYKNGNYQYAPEFRNLFPADLFGFVVLRDYNRDGKIDIFTDGPQGLIAYRNITPPGGALQFEKAADPVLTLTNSGRINLQVNYTDIPSIDDIDGDGDLDVLVYNFAIGLSIRYHKNMSMEKYGNPDSLDFELVNREWGQFEECQCRQFAFVTLGQTCDNLPAGRTMHIGGKSLLLVDMNGDGVMDLLEGHDLCNELYYFPNTGTRDTALMTSFSEYFPDTVNPANFSEFPAGYYDDFDNDGVKDLMVSSNNENNLLKDIDYKNSVWFYKNSGKDNLPSFHLVSKNYIQGNMIDVGEDAVPVLADLDNDGDLDLLVAGNGRPVGGTYYGYVTYYKNTGTAKNPEFTLADSDYLGLSSLRLFNMFIALADLNHDGAADLFISGTNPATDSITSEIIINTAGPGRPVQFSPDQAQAVYLPLSIGDTPCFTDIDNDGITDMLIGKITGGLDYYRNVSRGGLPDFILQQNDYLGITDSYVEFRRNLVPVSIDFDLDGKADLITSDYLGDLFIYWDYKNIVKKEQLVFYNLEMDKDEIWKQGYQTRLAAGKLFSGKFPVLLFGNNQGGITLYRQELPGNPAQEDKLVMSVYPDPLKNSDLLNVKASQDGRAIIYSMLGQPVSAEFSVTANRARPVGLAPLPAGMYIIKMTDFLGRHTAQRFIINH